MNAESETHNVLDFYMASGVIVQFIHCSTTISFFIISQTQKIIHTIANSACVSVSLGRKHLSQTVPIPEFKYNMRKKQNDKELLTSRMK